MIFSPRFFLSLFLFHFFLSTWPLYLLVPEKKKNEEAIDLCVTGDDGGKKSSVVCHDDLTAGYRSDCRCGCIRGYRTDRK
jgi:hypothetical protein